MKFCEKFDGLEAIEHESALSKNSTIMFEHINYIIKNIGRKFKLEDNDYCIKDTYQLKLNQKDDYTSLQKYDYLEIDQSIQTHREDINTQNKIRINKLFMHLIQLFIYFSNLIHGPEMSAEEILLNKEINQFIFESDIIRMIPNLFSSAHVSSDLIVKPNEQIGSLLLNWVNSIMLKHINDYEAMVSKLSKIRKDEKIEEINSSPKKDLTFGSLSKFIQLFDSKFK